MMKNKMLLYHVYAKSDVLILLIAGLIIFHSKGTKDFNGRRTSNKLLCLQIQLSKLKTYHGSNIEPKIWYN